MPDQYDNFDLLLERVQDHYEAKVVRSPVGETPTRTFDVPVSDLELRNLVLELRHAPDLARRLVPEQAPTSDLVRDIGSRLFDAVFQGQMLSCLHRSMDFVGWHDRAGLRIRLHFSEAPELARLPWEMLYDPESRNFLGLTQRTPVVRYLELPTAPRAQQPDGPLRMLVIVSSPTDYPQLDVAREVAIVREATAPLVRAGQLVVEVLPEATLEALERAGWQPYDMLHFVGHGGVHPTSGEGVLVFCDANGQSRLERGVDLGQQLRDIESLRLVVLNSCRGANPGTVDPFGGTAESLVLQGVPAVVAMQFEITDRAALKFAHSLYGALSEGRSVEGAVTRARRTLHAAARAEWATPVLHMRTQEGRLFSPVPAAPIDERQAPEGGPEPITSEVPEGMPPPPPGALPVDSPVESPAPSSDLSAAGANPSSAHAVTPSPSEPVPPPPPSSGGSTALALSPLGIVTVPLPFIIGARQTRRRDLWLRAAVYTAALVATLMIPTGNAGEDSSLMGFAAIALITIAIIDAFRVRRWIGHPGLRQWGRDVVARHPAHAQQWRIGRPDLTGGRVDGGLVDVNHAAAGSMRQFLGLTRSEARRIEAARGVAPGLTGPDDLVTRAGLSRRRVEQIEDRLLFL